jgi:hypothetical protein
MRLQIFCSERSSTTHLAETASVDGELHSTLRSTENLSTSGRRLESLWRTLVEYDGMASGSASVDDVSQPL